MAIDTKALPYGLRDVKVTPITADSATPTYSTMVDLPAGRTLTWSTNQDTEQLKGDDVVVAERGSGITIDWDLEHGGISLEALAVLQGGIVTSSGVTPSVIKTYALTGTTSPPYFRIDGQAINDNGGDTKVTIYRAKATGGVSGEFAEGGFHVTSCSGTGYPNGANKLFDIAHYETSAGIVQPA
jgi:hypothetical protein